MAADEQQPQDIVAIIGIVQPLDDIAFGILGIGNDVLIRQSLDLRPLAHRIDAAIAADEDEPGCGITRWPFLRPCPDRPETRFLKRLFRGIEIAEIAQQRAERLRAGRCKREVDPGNVCHDEASPGLKT